MRNISVIGNGLIGNCIAKTFHNVTLYGRKDAPSECIHDILIIAAPGGNRISIEADPDKDMLDCHKLVDTISKCTYNHLIYISSRDVLYQTVYGTNRKLLEEMILNLDNSVALRIGKALAPGLTRNILSDINNKTWLDKINLTNSDQWYPIKRLLLDADSLFTGKDKVDVFLSRPIYNQEIVTRYKPKLIKQLTKNMTTVQNRDDKHSTGNYIVPEQDIWQIFDTYFH